MATASDGFTDDDFRLLATLLHRYCSTELDQFDHWRVRTPFGSVFIALTQALPSDHPESAYVDITHPGVPQLMCPRRHGLVP